MIVQKDQVANIRGKAIYAVRNVVLIPLSSQAEAEKAVKKAPKSAKQGKDAAKGAGKDVETDVEAEESDVEEDEDAAATEASKGGSKQDSKVAEDEIQEKGRYGRFATRWFSRNGSKANARGKQGLSSQEDSPPEHQEDDNSRTPASDGKSGEVVDAQRSEEDRSKGEATKTDRGEDRKSPKDKSAIDRLTPRIVRNAGMFFSWSGFYFSYEHDISGTLMQKGDVISNVPMWKRFDSLVCPSSVESITEANAAAVFLEP